MYATTTGIDYTIIYYIIFIDTGRARDGRRGDARDAASRRINANIAQCCVTCFRKRNAGTALGSRLGRGGEECSGTTETARPRRGRTQLTGRKKIYSRAGDTRCAGNKSRAAAAARLQPTGDASPPIAQYIYIYRPREKTSSRRDRARTCWRVRRRVYALRGGLRNQYTRA